jgi:DNA mismatch repair protein MutL
MERRSIHILFPEVVSKIAAGEVVERPASVVKELVENSLDGGASQISIEVKGSGVNVIRVSDNGTGIPADEVELAFQPHATSKITSLADLDGATSLGFRGEALPSIAQVAQVEMLTCSKGDASGTYLCSQEGRIVKKESRACPQGTTVTVRNLFRKVPARLKFLKSATTENNQISNLVSQYGLACTGVRFTLSIDGRPVLRTPGRGKLRDVLAEVYGLEIAQAMLEIKDNTKEGALAPVVSGYISPPSVSRATRSYLSFFVNGRWVQSRLLAGAVEKASEGWLAVRRYPIAVINLAMSPQSVDVNVHPTKREVRFAQEPVVFHAVYGAVRRVLTEKAPIPEFSPSVTFAPTAVQKTVGMPSNATGPQPTPLPLMPEATRHEIPVLRVLGQAASAYIIAEGPDGLYLIDQHAAHERVLFDRILAQWTERTVDVQSLLEPIAIELSLKQEELLRARGELLAQFGFSMEPFGDRTCLIRAVPAMLVGVGMADAVKEALDSLDDEADPTKGEGRIARSLACHGAVRAGQLLSQEEMRELIGQLERTASPRTCPHGRPTMVHLSSGRLEKEFGRT